MVFERPNRPANQRPPGGRPGGNNPDRRDNWGGGGNRGGQGGGRGGNHLPPQPSPWLDEDNEPTPDHTASFVEYLRWMRSPDSPHKDPTKVKILQMAEEQGNYQKRLTQLTERTKSLAGEGNYFQVKCPWRLRVGGHRGPESILLPAFDALGMPYIPSATLRGVARTQAIREIMARDSVDWETAEARIAPWFGSLKAKGDDRSGKVIFFDAYPLPTRESKSGGLAVDMANNIWSWDAAGRDTNYSPNPNPFLSMKDATFMIGIRSTDRCSDEQLQQVRTWLIRGLQAGVGSQVNTGYGQLIAAGQGEPKSGFFQVEFSLQGQLIHGRQRFTEWNWNDRRGEYQMRGQAEAEVRPVAFKSMLRYWFRTFARGVRPANEVQTWEAIIFGGINPKEWGWLTVRIMEGRLIQQEAKPNTQGKNDPCGEQFGKLVLEYGIGIPADRKAALANLLKNLTWMLFHLGGIGQGARRPCYSRKTRDRAPWWRGSTLIPEAEDDFWTLPDTPQEFLLKFRQRLQGFYQALQQLTRIAIDPRNPLQVGRVTEDRWSEAVDANCRIVVCGGEARHEKPYALAVLHDAAFKTPRGDYDGNLCGRVQGGVKPSPVWIADLGDYQLVTVFGANQNPRQRYLQELQQRTSRPNYCQVWPL